MTEGEMAGEREGGTVRPEEAGHDHVAGEAADAPIAPSRDAALSPPNPRVPASDAPPSRDPALSPSDVTARTLAWLDAREKAPPPELRERIAAALAEVTAETVPGALAEAALACLRDTIAAPEERASALDLLAADALLTYALEAAAELGAEMVRRVAEEYGTGTLAGLLPEDER